jgi:hypothetical protein
MNNLFISSVDYKEEHYLINCIEISSSKDKIIKANKIYSCLGAISTTKIILQMSKKTSSVPLLTTPGGAFFIYSFKEFHNLNHQILSSRSFRGDLNNNLFEGNIFPFSENLIKTYFGQKLGKLLLILFGKLIFSRVFIANIYFSSDLSASTLININDEVKISAKTSSKLKFIFKKVMKNIYKEFFKRGLYIMPIGKKILRPGQDIHYGGSIPMKLYPKENQCDFKGELYGYKNFYVTDSTSMPFLASKGHSFNSMVNAYYISSNSTHNQS